jgi:hypothetical protein
MTTSVLTSNKNWEKKSEAIQVEEDPYQDENSVYDRVCVACGNASKSKTPGRERSFQPENIAIDRSLLGMSEAHRS